MSTFVNAMPQAVALGIQDLSIPPELWVPEQLPSHLAKVYLFTRKGPTTPQLVSGANRDLMYGTESFSDRGQYVTHATILSNTLNAQANAQIIQRVVPEDATIATSRVYLDVLPTQIQQYERGTDGKYVLDANGFPVATVEKVAGYKVKFVRAAIGKTVDGEDTFGVAARMAGDQTDADTQTQSMRYPLFDHRVASAGDHGNDLGWRMWASTTESSRVLDKRIVVDEKVYPFNFACVKRTERRKTGALVSTKNGATAISKGVKPEAFDRNTEVELYVGTEFLEHWQDLERTNLPPMFGPFGEFHVYQNNIDELLELFYEAELPFADEFSDFTDVADEKYRFNFVSGVSSVNVPYTTFQVVKDQANAEKMTELSTIWATGGFDGTMNEQIFADLVADELATYGDPEHPNASDRAKNPEGYFYDSGFPLKTKYEALKFVSVRKDTFLHLSTHDTLGRKLTAEEESSLGTAIFTRAQMYPESEEYGTPTARVLVMGRSGILLNSRYRKRLPLIFEVAAKSAEYMGAGDGRWKTVYNFDHAPRSEVRMFRDINVTFTPVSQRIRDWEVGLNWVESYTRRTYFIPALKTVYDEDRSILTSYFTVAAIVEIQKIADRIWRRYSGVSSMTNEQLQTNINRDVIELCAGRFDNRIIVRPNCFFTAVDVNNGYSWTLQIDVGAPNMKTVQVTTIRAFRIEDIQG